MSGLRVLIAEDNDDNIALLDRRLRKRGFSTLLARDGCEAVKKAVAEPPDLVLMDIEMPVMSGFDALAALRADANLRAIPVIAVTAHATSTIREACEQAGFDGFVTKPIDLAILLSEISRVAPATGDAAP